MEEKKEKIVRSKYYEAKMRGKAATTKRKHMTRKGVEWRTVPVRGEKQGEESKKTKKKQKNINFFTIRFLRKNVLKCVFQRCEMLKIWILI